jgi:hypothetical protein
LRSLTPSLSVRLSLSSPERFLSSLDTRRFFPPALRSHPSNCHSLSFFPSTDFILSTIDNAKAIPLTDLTSMLYVNGRLHIVAMPDDELPAFKSQDIAANGASIAVNHIGNSMFSLLYFLASDADFLHHVQRSRLRLCSSLRLRRASKPGSRVRFLLPFLSPSSPLLSRYYIPSGIHSALPHLASPPVPSSFPFLSKTDFFFYRSHLDEGGCDRHQGRPRQPSTLPLRAQAGLDLSRYRRW